MRQAGGHEINPPAKVHEIEAGTAQDIREEHDCQQYGRQQEIEESDAEGIFEGGFSVHGSSGRLGVLGD